MIVDRQEKEKWGKSVVEQLSKDVQIEFPGIRGFSSRNLWRMKDYYLTYKDNTKLPSLMAEIGWTHNIVIMEKCKDDLQREFYIKATIRQGWSTRTLGEKIETQEFERWALQQTNFDQSLPATQLEKAQRVVKDDYNFDFLLLEEKHKEREVEEQIIQNICEFLAEMDGYFAFVGRQVKVEIDDEDCDESEFFVDLLFYHRALRSLIAIDLKTTKFKPEHAGKMQFYLSALDDQVRLDGENSSIGIVVCKKKSRAVVEYTLRDVNRPIGVATYKEYNDKKYLPSDIAKYLPSKEDITKRLSAYFK